MKFRNNKFPIFVEDYNVPLAPWYIFNEDSFGRALPKMIGKPGCLDSLFYFEKNFVIWGADEKQFSEAGDFFSDKIMADESFVQEICEKHYECFKSVRRFSSLLKGLDKKSNKELYGLYEKYYAIFAEGFKWGMIIQVMEMGSIKFSEQVKLKLKNKFKKIGNPEVVFSKLISPIKQTLVAKESREILETIRKIQRDKKILAEIEIADSFGLLFPKTKGFFIKLSLKYGWLQFYYLGPAAGPEYYFDLIKKRLDVNVAEELKNKDREARELKNYQKKAEKIFAKKELLIIKTLREFAYLKEARKEIHTYYLDFVMQKWHEEVAKRFYWTTLQTKYIFKHEFKSILVDEKMIIDNNELNERYNCCAYFLKNGKFYFFKGKKAREMKEIFKKNQEEKSISNSFSGSVAYPGKAKGVVKIVNSTSDLNKFNEGDILVSFSTNPSLVPAMNKAVAIITNTGGVTCHAAIVARELKTPCIIGTKIATKVLKDGDEVEVDADKGVVKIIKKYE